MTKQKKKNTTKGHQRPKEAALMSVKVVSLCLFLFTVILYLNTIFNDFALDDAIVITDNEFTQKGIKGISDIFGKDTFHGFFGEAGKDKLVSGGRYRPFSLAMFAIERSIFGNSPLMHHVINVLLYALTGVLIYFLGFKIFKTRFNEKLAQYLAIGMALIYIAHPLHTEAVANIKGRDEIMAMLGSISAFYILARKSFSNLNWKDYFLAGLSLFIGLLSKENAITFVVVIPLAAFVIYEKTIIDSFKISLPFLAVASLFIAFRTAVIGFDFGAEPSMEFMNNPYLKIVNNQYIPFTGGEKLATIFFTLWKYIQLMVFPHPLTHDYYPNHISLKTFSNPIAVLGLLSYLGLIGISIWGILKKKLWSFFTSYYLLTISIVSNILFPIGTHMSERFLYMPSLAFAALVVLLLGKLIEARSSSLKLGMFIVVGLAILYSALTVPRNAVWKDNYTLFTTDAETSIHSAKVNNAAAGAIGEKLKEIEDGPEKKQLIQRSHIHLDNAIKAHPNYTNAYLLKGNAYFYENKYAEAIQSYQQSLRIDPEYEEAKTNLFICYRAAGRYYGEKMNDLTQALDYLKLALNVRPSDFETNRLIATCYGIMGNHALAVNHFKKCTEIEPNNAGAYVNLSKAYEFQGNSGEALAAKQKALSLDPNIFNK